MKDQLQIQIPLNLASHAVWQRSLVKKYETNAVIKALDTWLILKHETRSGLLQNWNKQKKYLLSICKVSESVFRHRLKILQGLKLLQYDRSAIQVCSWQDLSEVFEIDITEKFTIQYNFNDKQRIQEWIIAAEIKDNQTRQSYMILKNLNQNPAYRNDVISEMLKAGAERNQLKNVDYFLMWLRVLYYNDFVRASAIHSIMVEIRPDTNRGVKGIANAWKCKDPTTVSYWKQILQKSGIIDISKLQVESQERVRNNECKVVWLSKSKQTLLCLCDNITILTPWTVDKPLKSICKDNTDNADCSNINLSPQC